MQAHRPSPINNSPPGHQVHPCSMPNSTCILGRHDRWPVTQRHSMRRGRLAADGCSGAHRLGAVAGTPQRRMADNLRKRGSTKDSVALYAVQCYKCYKWSTVPKEEFETLRENFTKDPWFCSRRPDCSCADDADIEYDSSRIWVLDKPNIPKPPPGTERLVILRSDYSKMDTYYVMPNGKRARCAGDVDKFLEANPEYKNSISVSDFSFAPPKVVEETVSHNSAWKAAKAKKQEKAEAQK